MRSSTLLFSALLITAAAGAASTACKLPPKTTVPVDAANGAPNPEYPALTAAEANVKPDELTRDILKPVCDARGGKAESDPAQLPKMMAGIAEWQKLGKKAPPKPPEPPPDPNKGPVSVNGQGVEVRIPGLAGLAGKRRTDTDPQWFAVSCDGGKIRATLDEETMELDALYMQQFSDTPELWLAGYSLKNKTLLTTKINTTPRPNNIPNTSFLIFDLSRYLVANVEDVAVQAMKREHGYMVYFLEAGKTAGLGVATHMHSDYVSVGRFAVGNAATASK